MEIPIFAGEQEKTTMKQVDEGQLGPMKLIFNYEDIFYSFFYGSSDISRDAAIMQCI